MNAGHVNKECDVIPKVRIEMLGKRGCSLYLDGKCMDVGIKRVEFIAEGCKDSPILNLSLDTGAFMFRPELDLIEKPQHISSLESVELTEENKRVG